MIPAFLEGLAQSLLPCSWVLLVPALLMTVATSRAAIVAAFSGSVVIFVWGAVAGWLTPPLWIAGAVLLLASVAWWLRGAGIVQAGAIGAGAAWAWQPCVGAELGKALNLAQQDPIGALPGLGAFIIGVVAVGLVIGWLARTGLGRLGRSIPARLLPLVVGILGLLMLSGLYGDVASTLARWSTAIWG